MPPLSASGTSAGIDAHASADFKTCVRTGDPGEAWPVLGTRIRNGGMRLHRLFQMLRRAIGLLSGAQRRQHHNNERKGKFSHQRFYHDPEYSQAIIGTLLLFFRPAGWPCICGQIQPDFALRRFADCFARCTSHGPVYAMLGPQFFFRLVDRPCTSERTLPGFVLQYFAVRTALCTLGGLVCVTRERSVQVKMMLMSALARRTEGPTRVGPPKDLVGIAFSTPELPAAAWSLGQMNLHPSRDVEALAHGPTSRRDSGR